MPLERFLEYLTEDNVKVNEKWLCDHGSPQCRFLSGADGRCREPLLICLLTVAILANCILGRLYIPNVVIRGASCLLTRHLVYSMDLDCTPKYGQ